MKLKKMLALLVTGALTVGTMAGCSQATLNYSKEIANTVKWEATTSNIDGKINVEAEGIKEEISFTAVGYASGDYSKVDMKFNDPSGKYKIPELKAYVNGTTTYINKSFYEGIFTVSGQPIPKGLSDLKQTYIGLDQSSSGIEVKEMKALMSKSETMIEMGKMIFGNSDVDLPFTQNGREYTINLNSDQTVDLAAKAIKAAINNFDNINNSFKLGLTSEDITQIKTMVNDASFEAGLTEAKAQLAGSTISSKEVFTDTTYTQDFNMNLKIKDTATISISMKSSSEKSDVQSKFLPYCPTIYTEDQFNEILAPETTGIE